MSKSISQNRRQMIQKRSSILKPINENIQNYYAIQNENDVLKLQNNQLEDKIKLLTIQLINFTSNIAKQQQQCQMLKKQIRIADFTQDIKLEQEKGVLEEKVQFTQGNCQIFSRKIAQVRESTVNEENKIPQIVQQKKQMQKKLWKIKTQNEGNKYLLINIQKQLDKKRQQNASMVQKRKQYSPKQIQIQNYIESKLKINSNKYLVNKQIIKKYTAQLIFWLFHQMYFGKLKSVFILVQKTTVQKKIMQKQLFLMSVIRRKYLMFIKNYILQKFRQGFRPIHQLQGFQRIIQNTIKRRNKNKMFRIWRNQSNKRQYIKIRCLEAETTIEKVAESYRNTLYFSAFNQLKYYGNNQIHKRGALIIQSISKSAHLRTLNLFMSILINKNNKCLNDLQLQQSAKSSTILLSTSLYFSNWAKLTKQNKLSNRYIKYKYFRELKKLLVLKKKRNLSQMLALSHQKLKQVNTCSLIFCQLKKQTCWSLVDGLDEAEKAITVKNNEMIQKINASKLNYKDIVARFGLFKFFGFLKKLMQRYFGFCKNYQIVVQKLQQVLNMLHHKSKIDLSCGFARIQLRCYELVKISMRNSIQHNKQNYIKIQKQNRRIQNVLQRCPTQIKKMRLLEYIKKLIRDEKEIKKKYYYKFMKNGYQFWKQKKTFMRMQSIVIKQIINKFIYNIKLINYQQKRYNNIQNYINKKIQTNETNLKLLSFTVLQNKKTKNIRIKKILESIYNKNIQIQLYKSYNIIKRQFISDYKKQMILIQQQHQIQISSYNKQIYQSEKYVQMLRDQELSKIRGSKNVMLLYCYKRLITNLKSTAGKYFNQWRNKLKVENNVRKFVQIMERKTRNAVKNAFVIGLIRKNGESQIAQLKTQIKQTNEQFRKSNKQFDKYISQSQTKIKTMTSQNNLYDQQTKIFQNKIQNINKIKIYKFQIYSQSKKISHIFLSWKHYHNLLINKLSNIYHILNQYLIKFGFITIFTLVKYKKNINKKKIIFTYIFSKIYKKYTNKIFTKWRINHLNKKIQQYKKINQQQLTNQKYIIKKYQNIIKYYDGSIDYRISNLKKRKIFNSWKQYSKIKIYNDNKKNKLEMWLKRGYKIQLWKLFIKKSGLRLKKNKKADQFHFNRPINKMKKLFYKLATIAKQKKCVSKLFFTKFLKYEIQNICSLCFNKIYNYSQYIRINSINYNTFCLQNVLSLFDKKRKDILCKNIRKWKKNLFQISIGKKLVKRLTRKAICNKLMDMYYGWKLQAQGRSVLKYHLQQGEIKKRKLEMIRIQNFLQQYKKQKGLLLQNEQGRFVMSPSIKKRYQQQEKQDKRLRYKFISRLIMNINGSQSMIKSYNNLTMFMRLRQKYKKTSLFILNHIKRPDKLIVFRIWRQINQKFKNNFINMDRKQLITILNKQKIKLEIQYGKKLSIDFQIQIQLKRYKLLAFLKLKKQKLCIYILLKNIKNVKQIAFKLWRYNSNQMKLYDGIQLSKKGINRLKILQQQIQQLQQVQSQTQQNNNRLKATIRQAIEIADMVKKISQERDKLSHLISQKNLTCESLIQENQNLNSKLHLAQKQALQLLIISGEQP